MKHSLIVSLIALLACPPVVAQDSTRREWQSADYANRYSFYVNDITTQPLGLITFHGRLNAAYRTTKGAYHQAQAAPGQHNISFETDGTRQLGKYLLSGYFGYTHTLQDSVAYTLRSDPDDPQPYYFFAYKPGNWQTGEYNVKGMLARKFAKEKLATGLGVHYRARNEWRSNDPRPEVFHFQTEVEASVHYKILPQHSIGVSGTWGGRKNESSVQYRNKDYQLSLAYPEYVRRMQFGYGFDDRAATSQMKARGTGYGWKGIYHFQSPVMLFTARGGYSYQESSYTGDSTLYFRKGKYGEFYEDRWQADVYGRYKWRNKVFSLRARYVNHLGRDFNEFLKSNNYVYSFESISLKPGIGFYQDSLLAYELGFDVSVTDLFRADGNAGVVTDYQFAYAGLNASRFFTFKKKDWLQAKIDGGMRFPLSSTITLPVQQSNFVKYVVAGDYYFYDARTITGALELKYGRPFKGCDGFFKFRMSYDRAQLSSADLTTLWMPGRERWFWEAGIGITLHR